MEPIDDVQLREAISSVPHTDARNVAMRLAYNADRRRNTPLPVSAQEYAERKRSRGILFQGEGEIVDLTAEFKAKPTRQEIKEHLNTLVGKALNTRTEGILIDILNSGKKKKHIIDSSAYQTMRNKEKKRHEAYVFGIEKLVGNAEYTGSAENRKSGKKPNVARYHYFEVPVRIGEHAWNVQLVCEEMKKEPAPQTATVSRSSPAEADSSHTEDTTSLKNLQVENVEPVHLYDVLEKNILFQNTEEDEVRMKYAGSNRWMKTPNGKDTKLTEKQWLQVRTPSFKAWFGDWEKPFRIGKLRASKPVEISGTEIKPDADFKQYKKNALEYGKKLRGTYTNKDTGEKIPLTGGNGSGGIREILQHDYKDAEHLQSVAAIPQIIENGIFIDELANEDKENHKDIKSFRYYVCGLKIGETEYTVKAVVAVQNNGERYYDHKLTSIEKGKLLDLINGQAADRKALYPEIQKSGSALEIKDTRLREILQVNSSKAVDENGEPLVVYHGSRRGGFDVFDNTKGDGKYKTPEGMAFFARDRLTAYSYSGSYDSPVYFREEDDAGYIDDRNYQSMYECFLNIRDPYESFFDGVNWEGTAYGKFELFSDETGTVTAPDGSTYWDSWEEAEAYAEEQGLEDYSIEEDPNTGTTTDYEAKYARESGHDGAIIHDVVDGSIYADPDKTDVYVVFSPEQIKSATDNAGTFDPDNPSILFQQEEGIVDLTAEFKANPTRQEIKEQLNALVGKAFNTRTAGKLIDILNSGKKKKHIIDSSAYHNTKGNKKKRHNAYVFGIEQLIENAEYTGSADNRKTEKKPNVERYHYFEVPVRIGNHAWIVQLVCEETKKRQTPQTAIISRSSGRRPALQEDDTPSLKNLQVESVEPVHLYDVLEGKMLFQQAYHGSPHNFDRFSTDAIGSGEGMQVFGWGLYFTDNRGIAEGYAKKLAKPKVRYKGENTETAKRRAKDLRTAEEIEAGEESVEEHMLGFIKGMAGKKFKGEISDYKETIKKLIKSIEKALKSKDFPLSETEKRIYRKQIEALRNIDPEQIEILSGPRNLYTVDIPDGDYIKWDGPLTEGQKRKITEQARKEGVTDGRGNPFAYEEAGEWVLNMGSNTSGEIFYRTELRHYFPDDKAKSLFLARAGIKGIDYPAGSLSGGAKGRNFVVFDDRDVQVQSRILFQMEPIDDVQLREAISSVPHTEARRQYIRDIYESRKDSYETREFVSRDGKLKGRLEVYKQRSFKGKEHEIDDALFFASKGIHVTLLAEDTEAGGKYIDALFNHETLVEFKRVTGTSANGVANNIKDAANKMNSEVITVFFDDRAEGVGYEDVLERLEAKRRKGDLKGSFDRLIFVKDGKASLLKQNTAGAAFAAAHRNPNIAQDGGSVNRESAENTTFRESPEGSTRLLFQQTEKELLDDAASFDSWQDFMEFYESFGKPEDSIVPSGADEAWYRTAWELARKRKAERETGMTAEDRDALFIREMEDGGLEDFLTETLHFYIFYVKYGYNAVPI